MNAKTSIISKQPSAPAKRGRDALKIDVAQTLDELMQVISLRAMVYLGEQNCPYGEEFDGNDFAGATHLIARVGGEPAGVMRLRWFAGFAKAERAAVRACFRGRNIGFALMDRAVEIAACKGYQQMLGHVEPALLDFWKRRKDVQVRKNRPSVTFSDRTYAEICIRVPTRADALSIETPALVLNRAEGAWGRAGVLDRSAQRQRAGLASSGPM